ncbi:MAG: hypothetical protein ACJ8FY_24925 [Gemmataceae bacterium]
MESVFFIGLGAVVAVLLLFWHFSRSNSLVDQWARENGYRIIRRQYRSFFKGPFFWTSTRGQTVYQVVVEDAAGNRRNGWLRCGSWWFGLLSNNVEARWDS